MRASAGVILADVKGRRPSNVSQTTIFLKI